MEQIQCVINYAVKPENIFVMGLAMFLVIGAFLTYKKSKSYKTRINMLYVILGAIPFATVFVSLNTSCLCNNFCIDNTIKLISVGILGAIIFLGILYHLLGSRLYLIAINGKRMNYDDCPEIYDTLKDICSRIGIKMPILTYIDSAEPIAMSISGHMNMICLSIGTMESLEKEELRAVLAHEALHIKSHDPLIKFILKLIGISYLYGFMLTKNVELEQEKMANDAAEMITSKNVLKSAAMKFSSSWQN